MFVRRGRHARSFGMYALTRAMHHLAHRVGASVATGSGSQGPG